MPRYIVAREKSDIEFRSPIATPRHVLHLFSSMPGGEYTKEQQARENAFLKLDEVKYLYIDLQLTAEGISEYLIRRYGKQVGLSPSKIMKFLSANGIRKRDYRLTDSEAIKQVSEAMEEVIAASSAAETL